MRNPIIALLLSVLIIAGVIFAAVHYNKGTAKAEPASKSPVAMLSIVPEDIQAEVERAVKDPVINGQFLVEVLLDPSTQLFLSQYPSLQIDCNEAQSIIFYADSQNETSRIVVSVMVSDLQNENTANVGIDLQSGKLDCEAKADKSNRCEAVQELFARTKQSEFFERMKHAVSLAAGPNETRSVKK